jgi:hypothetical protein
MSEEQTNEEYEKVMEQVNEDPSLDTICTSCE